MSTRASVRFIYLFCRDLAAMRHFYTDLVGLNEIFHSDGPDGSVAYDCDGLQFTVFLDKDAPMADSGWARQPGWRGGSQPAPSWSIPVLEEAYGAVVERLAKSGAATFSDAPRWVNYWSYPVKDPMGNTVEIVMSPEVEPEDERWRG